MPNPNAPVPPAGPPPARVPNLPAVAAQAAQDAVARHAAAKGATVSPPTSPVDGDTFTDGDGVVSRFVDGTGWVEVSRPLPFPTPPVQA